MPVTIHRQWPLVATTIGGQAGIHSICSYDECEFRGRESLPASRLGISGSESGASTWRTVATLHFQRDHRRRHDLATTCENRRAEWIPSRAVHAKSVTYERLAANCRSDFRSACCSSRASSSILETSSRSRFDAANQFGIERSRRSKRGRHSLAKYICTRPEVISRFFRRENLTLPPPSPAILNSRDNFIWKLAIADFESHVALLGRRGISRREITSERTTERRNI